jgi:hypothetical protein
MGVSELGALLAALHGPVPRFATVHARVRSWRHVARADAAFRRAAEAADGAVLTACLAGDEPEPEAMVTVGELWVDGQRRRADTAAGVAIAVAGTWWHLRPDGTAMTNAGEEEPAQMSVGGELEPLLEPWSLAGALVLDADVEPATAIGREALRARARPRPGDDRHDGWRLHAIGWGADEYELVVDRERGVLLRAAARLGGEEFQVMEIEAIEFDAPIADAVFVFDPPAGTTVVTASEPEPPRTGPLHEIAAAAPFTVWAPADMPAEWRLRASIWEPQDACLVNLHYDLRRPGGGGLSIVESRSGGPRQGYNADAGGWRRETHDGRELDVLEPPGDGDFACVHLVLEGTRIELQGQQLGLETLIGVATALVPAPTEPPRLTGP